MTDIQIHTLAREFAEEATKADAGDPNLSASDLYGIKRDVAEYAEEVIRFLLRRYALVEKSKVIIKYKNMKRLEEDATAFGFKKHRNNAKVVKSFIESLFPEIGKEAE